MSRIGNKPVSLPKGVEVSTKDGELVVKGSKGTLTQKLPEGITFELEDGVATLKRASDSRQHKALHGLIRSLLANMVEGVSNGFQKSLDLVGVGYRVAANGKGLTLSVGFSHPVEIDAVDGVDFEVIVDNRAKINRVLVKGIDKQLVGQVAANIRSVRPPEPYKGKGIRYTDEHIVRKAGKAGKA